MTRLYDRLCIEPPRPCFGDDPTVLDDDFFHAVVFDIQQVADYFFGLVETMKDPATGKISMPVNKVGDNMYEVWASDYFGFDWRDIAGCIIPPYENVFCEFDSPDSLKMMSHIDDSTVIVGKVGCWMSRIDRDELDATESGRQLVEALAKTGLETDEIGHFVNIEVFFDKPGRGGLMGPAVVWGLPLDREGRIFNEGQENRYQPKMMWRPPISLSASDDLTVAHFAQMMGTSIIVPALMALNILHTPQDVEWHVREHTEPNRQLAKKWAKHKGRALVSYYVLEIAGVKRRMTEGGHTSLGEVLRALHTVRGHPKYYKRTWMGSPIHPKNGRPISPENPFMVFVPEHERGSVKAGKVDKDYLVRQEGS